MSTFKPAKNLWTDILDLSSGSDVDPRLGSSFFGSKFELFKISYDDLSDWPYKEKLSSMLD